MTRRRGRPAYRATAAQRREVEQMVACGMPKAAVARALDIHEETLDKHFAEELQTGRAKRRREVIGLLFRQARGGNVSATKKLLETIDLAETSESVAESKPVPRAERPGKKEMAAELARTAGRDGDWGDDLDFPGGRRH